MSILFGREYQLIVGRPQQLTEFIIPRSIVAPRIIDGVCPVTTDSNAVISWDHVPSEWYEITDEGGNGLQITADINQTKETANPCKITITNALQDNVNRIRKDDLIILRAGYNQAGGNFIEARGVGLGREQWPDLFVGQVAQVYTDYGATERITHILAGEALTVRKNSKISYSWLPDTSRLTVLNELIGILKTQGIPLGRLTLPKEGTQELENLGKPYLTGFTIKGYVLDEFEKFCSSVGLRVYTATGKVYIEPKTSTPTFQVGLASPVSTELPPSVEIFTVTPANVKGKVQPLSDNVGQSSNKDNTKDAQGIKISTFLNGQITVAKVLRLQGFEGDYDGDYEIKTVQHKLDFRSSGTWNTIVTAERL